jgi:hypothetical protein
VFDEVLSKRGANWRPVSTAEAQRKKALQQTLPEEEMVATPFGQFIFL